MVVTTVDLGVSIIILGSQDQPTIQATGTICGLRLACYSRTMLGGSPKDTYRGARHEVCAAIPAYVWKAVEVTSNPGNCLR